MINRGKNENVFTGSQSWSQRGENKQIAACFAVGEFGVIVSLYRVLLRRWLRVKRRNVKRRKSKGPLLLGGPFREGIFSQRYAQIE